MCSGKCIEVRYISGRAQQSLISLTLSTSRAFPCRYSITPRSPAERTHDDAPPPPPPPPGRVCRLGGGAGVLPPLPPIALARRGGRAGAADAFRAGTGGAALSFRLGLCGVGSVGGVDQTRRWWVERVWLRAWLSACLRECGVCVSEYVNQRLHE